VIQAELREQVFRANQNLVRYGLVTLTWGNVSAIDRRENVVVIKPSGIAYEDLKPADMVIVDMDGQKADGDLKPSSDTPTHLALYRAFPEIGGICHTHSLYATIFCQAGLEIPCLGTTHADHFAGTVPITRFLTKIEVQAGYELNTGTVIIERFAGLDPVSMPAVLVNGHAPFCWGQNAKSAIENSVALEQVARMAYGSMQLNAKIKGLPKHILEKHYRRKHGPDAYYGQAK
jgi:L-ribulose-5-phosphate 4-epimerase